MPFWSWLCDCLSGTTHEQHDSPVFNPSTGLPMIDNNIGSVDVGGSPFGQDVHDIGSIDVGDHPFGNDIHDSGCWMDFGGGFDGHDNM